MSRNRALIATVLGSSLPSEGTRDYSLAFEVGRMLAQTGFVVANGGYGGIMEASHRGASTVGGYTIAITTNFWPKKSTNKYAQETRVSENPIERIHMLYEVATVIVGLPGRTGTLSGLAYAWYINQRSGKYKSI